MAKSLIPKSKAKTAYGLLSEVRSLILAEPLRYNQGWWLTRKNNPEDFCETETFPSCGTVGCVAGWVATLRGPKHFGDIDAEFIAADILGIDVPLTDELFSSEAVTGKPQTAAYAAEGARHIARFQKKYARQLKAKKV